MLTPIPPFPALSDRADNSYNSKAFNWASHMANVFPGELNALLANLNSIAAGGAYAIPYVWGDPNAPGGINIGGGSPSQQYSFALDVGKTNAAAFNVHPLLQQFGHSTSEWKGYIRLVKATDPSAFLVFAVSSVGTDFPNYRVINGGAVHASSLNPFANGDPVMLYFDRNGDKGDTGPMNVYPYAEFTEQHASGVNANGGAVATNTYIRNINTVVSNSIPGASLSGAIVTLPPGQYEFDGLACAVDNSSSQNRSALHNITDNTYVVGMGAVLTGSTSNTYSTVNGRFTIPPGANKTFKLITDIGPVGTVPGQALNRGFAEIYAKLRLWKLA